MDIRQEILPESKQGSFVFYRPTRGGEEPVIVETEFTGDQLKNILDLAREDGPYAKFCLMCSLASNMGSGLGREIQVSDIKVPRAFGLKSKDESIVMLNYLATVVVMLSETSDDTIKKLFFNVYSSDSLQTIQDLATEITTLLGKYNWHMGVAGQNRRSDAIVNWIATQLSAMKDAS